MTNLIGQSLGRYHILDKLGEGGMATVYKAFDTHLETEVAVKVIRTEKFTPEAISRALKRFEREAKALARLTHPNIVKVIDYGEYEGQPYLVMPFLPGGNLKERLNQNGPMPWQQAARLLLPIAQALDFAHNQNVIHRDVKPSNILLTKNGQPMLTDFGVAKVLEEEATVDLTGTSATVGTPEYMAPEQASSKSVDHRVDIYSLGIVFYEMVTGRKPYTADTPLAVLIKQASEPLPRPKKFAPTLPEAVEKVLLKALAKDPKDRYQDMATFSAGLEKVLGGKFVQNQSTDQPKVIHPQKPVKIDSQITVVQEDLKSQQARDGLSPVDHESLVEPSRRPTSSKRLIAGGLIVILCTAGLITLASGVHRLGLGGLGGLSSKPTSPNITGTLPATDTYTNTTTTFPTVTIKILLSSTQIPSIYTGLSTISVKNASNLKELTRFSISQGGPASIAFSPDGDILAVGGDNVKLYKVSDRPLIRTLVGHTGWVTSVAFSPNGAYLASGSYDNTVNLWRVSDGTLLGTLLGHSDKVNSVAFSKDGSIIASASDDETIKMWSVTDKKLLHTLKSNKRAFTDVSFSPTDPILASVAWDGVELWNAKDGSWIRSLINGGANCLTFSSDGQLLAIGYNYTAGVYKSPYWSVLGFLDGNQYVYGYIFNSLAFSPDGTIIVSGARDAYITIWNPHAEPFMINNIKIPPLNPQTGYVYPVEVAFSPDGRLLAVGSAEGWIYLWGVQ